MKNRYLLFDIFFICFSILIHAELFAYPIAIDTHRKSKTSSSSNLLDEIRISKATGNIWLYGSPDTVTLYMHIPISCKEQVPIYYQVNCNRVKNYRFVKYDGTGVLMAANLIKGSDQYLKWTAYVITKEDLYEELPDTVPISQLNTLPDSVKQWLLPTDCCQSDNPEIISLAKSIAAGETNVISIAKKVLNYVNTVPWIFMHGPLAFDAYYAYKWGNSCTGHAHIAIALLRALGIPARSLLNIPYWYEDAMDQHWIADFFVPNYGWVNMETSLGEFKWPTSATIITYISNASDEFPVFYTTGCDTKWAYSEPGNMEPGWGRAHHSELLFTVATEPKVTDKLLSVCRKVYDLYTNSWGIKSDQINSQLVQSAYAYQSSGFNKLFNVDVDGFLTDMNSALTKYSAVGMKDLQTVYSNNFESTQESFTHYGPNDQWEFGTPTKLPYSGYLSSKCWGTKMSGPHDTYANAYLESPSIDITNLSCAYLSFWTWNNVQSHYITKLAGFHVEISTDGITYKNVMETLRGKTDDPEIPQKSGWTNVVADLTNYVGNKIKVRFHFNSAGAYPSEGSFIDDFKVYGREKLWSNDTLKTSIPTSFNLYNNYPNPFNNSTVIKYHLPEEGLVSIKVFDILGREVTTLVNEIKPAGFYDVKFDANNLTSGVYFYTISFGKNLRTKSMVLLK